VFKSALEKVNNTFTYNWNI